VAVLVSLAAVALAALGGLSLSVSLWSEHPRAGLVAALVVAAALSAATVVHGALDDADADDDEDDDHGGGDPGPDPAAPLPPAPIADWSRFDDARDSWERSRAGAR
jgi:hypothetical protein